MSKTVLDCLKVAQGLLPDHYLDINLDDNTINRVPVEQWGILVQRILELLSNLLEALGALPDTSPFTEIVDEVEKIESLVIGFSVIYDGTMRQIVEEIWSFKKERESD